MARRSTKRPVVIPTVGTRLPADWRIGTSWQVWAMLAKIPHTQYEAEVAAFEAYHAGYRTLSGDWVAEWKAWCHRELIEKSLAAGRLTEAAAALDEPDFEAMFG